ncbi:hypothetical protein [Microbacterium invictum]|uniref:Alpha/beta-hydrolase family hydrolase n=1 Tax=Microbacterium invictum TaxID=515415 RepID=A0AA40SQW3_9MICO|nr:hypothetical protein [Microbacterium invictum]MBB4140728.1 putative alpha/beta-hydrolase family hydrolase [Microbacterium invictum]
MSDLEIRSGSVIAVNTHHLRHTAGRLMSLAAECEVVQRRLHDISAGITDEGAWANLPLALVAEAIERTRSIAADLRTLATIYEMVELEIQRDAAAAIGDDLSARSLTGRLAALSGTLSLPEQVVAWQLTRGWRADSHRELTWQSVQAGLPFGPFGWAVSAVVPLLLVGVRGLDRGAVPNDARLRGPTRPVSLSPHRLREATTAPATVADVARRLPDDTLGRVRVERYTMPDRSRQFVAYIAGTRFGGDDEPFDMTSNLELYDGVRSASYEATVEALRASGAGPGDTVHLAGHSQGGMIASRVALEHEFRVETIITFGSPVQADVGADTLQVAVRHTDDLVSALSAGGFEGASGAPGSFVAERVADPVGTIGDVTFDVHQMEAYTETAELLDSSTDPRMDAVRESLAPLATATSVSTTVYGAERGTARRAGGGGA